MKDDFFKFPSTPHLALLGDVEVREDKVMSKAGREEFLRHELVVEEKIDGANLGISFDTEGNIRAQNRGAYLEAPYNGQWKKLNDWLTPRINGLFEQLGCRYILFGEWCYAKHSVVYDLLPDWFLGFDIYDKGNSKFFSSIQRDKVLQTLGISQIPNIAKGHFTFPKLKSLLLQSQFSSEEAEGLYLRHDQGAYLKERAKLVRPAFILSQKQHWSRSGIQANQVK